MGRRSNTTRSRFGGRWWWKSVWGKWVAHVSGGGKAGNGPRLAVAHHLAVRSNGALLSGAPLLTWYSTIESLPNLAVAHLYSGAP